ncbi:MAG: biotin--[acetyl-CoA-carboxylase] ligase [Eubacteriales bacterium]|nr:biotin--[acetyl-CoA-carboxylase] ligase [Eubacteriales bacterium]
MKSEILNVLRASDGYVSGQELCDRFGVSRTAIWKGIHQLKEEGYEIEAVPRKGYRLCGCPDHITQVELESRMQTGWAAKKLYYLDTVDSTNDYAKRLAEEGAQHGTVVVADEQTKGKGRRGRVWETPAGTNIAMSMVVRPQQLAPEKASMMTLLAGMAVACAVRETTGLEVGIKWPNDTVIHGKKISGTLTEMSMELGAIHYLVIGTGINANMDEVPEYLRETATTLKRELGRPVNRAQLICAYMKSFEEYYDKFMEHQDLSLLIEEYHSMLVNKDREVRVLEPGHEYNGIARGINAQGCLLVEKKDGSIAEVYAGEVSVRGIYGYT